MGCPAQLADTALSNEKQKLRQVVAHWFEEGAQVEFTVYCFACFWLPTNMQHPFLKYTGKLESLWATCYESRLGIYLIHMPFHAITVGNKSVFILHKLLIAMF